MSSFDLLQLLELQVAMSKIENELQRLCKRTVNLSFAEVVVLLCILHKPISCEKDIAAIRGVSRSAVSQSIQGLVAKKLVTRNEDIDRRKKRPTLTSEGAEKANKVQPVLESFARSRGEGVAAKDVRAFKTVIATISKEG